MDPTLFWYVVATVLVLVGLAGVILPALPGLPLVFTGMLVAAWAGDFERIGVVPLVLLGLLTLLSIVADFVATAAGAKRVGAGPMAVWGAALGTLITQPGKVLSVVLGVPAKWKYLFFLFGSLIFFPLLRPKLLLPALPTIAVMRQRVRSEPGWRVAEMATGHDPMVSEPAALAALLLDMARG